MADYFTFPHNKTYKGNLAAHNSYEAELKNRLKNVSSAAQQTASWKKRSSLKALRNLWNISVSVMHIIWKARGALPMTSVLSFWCAIRLYRDFSALCQKTVSYGRTAGSDCLTVYKKPQCVRALWLFYVMVNSKKSYKNVNKK